VVSHERAVYVRDHSVGVRRTESSLRQTRRTARCRYIFSRPLSRPEYILSRLLVLVGCFLQSPDPRPAVVLDAVGMAGWTWFTENWRMGSGVFFGFLLWIFWSPW
jgi:hypothetical protein